MKKILVAFFISLLSLSAFASDIIKASQNDYLNILDQVRSVQSTYSTTSKLDAKIVELITEPDYNNNSIRMVLVFGTGSPTEPNRIFMLNKNISEATRITFLEKDVIVINYIQNSYDDEGLRISIKKSMKINVLRDASGNLKGEIEISSL